ncbi:hypothetical protein FEE95_11995 [Maribacter algarum]|uniref:Uncharacterized protein n=1 Tax=Maribacter algarum (ex Zhang et al. 2020) TaxID=2578118 RepID=A0A5S3PR83_9FLAO|nr:hypothetical protein [Maribacter algarum]TMM57204.1 hypothetical protein FEE95_11995 [Maribacter algarum]
MKKWYQFIDWIKSANINIIVAFTALLTSVCALYISIQEVHIMRTQQKALMFPYLTLGKIYNSDGFGIRLKNSGNGLAKINSYKIHNDSMYFKDWEQVVQILAPEAKNINYSIIKTSGGIQDEIITPDEDLNLIFLQWTDETRKLEKTIKSLKIEICYSSLLDDYWTVQGKVPVESSKKCRVDLEMEFGL